MFLSKALIPNNPFWKYLVGSVIVIMASTFGQVPLFIAAKIQLMLEGKPNAILDQDSIMSVLDKNITLFLILFSFLVALFGIILVVKYIHKQRLIDIITSRPKIDWKRVFFSFSIWAVFQIIVTVVGYYAAPEDYHWNFQWGPFLGLFIIASLMIPIQTSVEELVFRGYLMQGFARLSRNKLFPLVWTSIIFGGLHLFNPEVAKMGKIIMIYYIGTGFFLGILTLMDEGMELALGFHAANNLITALLVTSEWTAFQTNSVLKDVSNPSVGFEIFVPVFVVFPILLFLFSKKYGWSDWKEKLTGKVEDTTIDMVDTIGSSDGI